MKLAAVKLKQKVDTKRCVELRGTAQSDDNFRWARAALRKENEVSPTENPREITDYCLMAKLS